MNTFMRKDNENNNSTKSNVLATSISVVPSSLIVPEGATTTFHAIISPSNTINSSVKFTHKMSVIFVYSAN